MQCNAGSSQTLHTKAIVLSLSKAIGQGLLAGPTNVHAAQLTKGYHDIP